ncbi:erythromycin esterase family protein [Streptomyces cacaoi]|uniref:erythromycin esterase family protein n=1 Tax=Streptomyces cacaoi TaxID=1898 RepID=UPI0011F2760D|nr:erythromycin esterase family protein [Streptomyces cacaoi]
MPQRTGEFRRAGQTSRHGTPEQRRSALPPARDASPHLPRGREHQRRVINELTPRLAEAADAVADYIGAVEQAAADRVREAEQARDAALAEAATALREAADADTRATTARDELDKLATQHQELRDRHEELRGSHARLTEEYERLNAHDQMVPEGHAKNTAKAGCLEAAQPKGAGSQREHRAAQVAARFKAPNTCPDRMDLGEIDGHNWALVPDPDRPGSLLVITVLGAITPRGSEGRRTGRWDASHRRQRLKPDGGRKTFPDCVTAIAAVINAEAERRPLPPADDPVWELPPGYRMVLGIAAERLDPNRGQLSRLEPRTYRDRLGKSLRLAAGCFRMSPDELSILLDAPRDDFGTSKAATHLYETLQRIRNRHIAPASS